jgi:integrase
MVKAVQDTLRSKHSKYEVLFCLGVATGLRVGDLLKLRVRDLVSGQLAVREQKTGKIREIEIKGEVMGVIGSHVKTHGLRDGDYLIFSRPWKQYRPLTRQQAWSVLRGVGRELGIRGIGTHTMRKTFARGVYKASGDIVAVQGALAHEHIATTIGYLCGPRALAWMMERYAEEVIGVNGTVE